MWLTKSLNKKLKLGNQDEKFLCLDTLDVIKSLFPALLLRKRFLQTLANNV